uniref:Non-specific protein-tyrosine kinase n=1 Tax=Panagrolaimus sp. JU765 TaxID=591449 RepID=A0AC34R5A0_9BILA
MLGLDEEDFFHGLLPREDLASMCRNDGDFAIVTDVINPVSIKNVFVLVKTNQKLKELTISKNRSKFYFANYENVQCNSIVELVRHFHKKLIPIREVILKNPVHKYNWELIHKQVDMGAMLGEGAQAQVKKGFLTLPGNKKMEAAIKIYKGDVTKEKLAEIMHEVRIMLALNHENIVRMYGVALCRAPLLIVLDLVHGGSLDRYLKIKKTEISVSQKVCMCADAASGIAFIHRAGILHRDIAARNCLYSQSKQRVLISDFGLSRKGELIAYEEGKKLPVRWLAVEVLVHYVASKMSDVWSYGVLCWEIFNHCNIPFGNIPSQQAVVNGGRLSFNPPKVPEILIDTVHRCWNEDPNARPTMAEIAEILAPLNNKQKSKPSFHTREVKMRSAETTKKEAKQIKRQISQVEPSTKMRKQQKLSDVLQKAYNNKKRNQT